MLAMKLSNIDFYYGVRPIIKFKSLTIYDGERIGLIGDNGSGKSTLLGLMSGEKDASPGSVERLMSVSCCNQSIGPFNRPSDEMLSFFGGSEGSAVPSGGEKMRYKLAAAFTPGKGLLLLDEPTTDLDLDGILLLRDAIRRWDGPIVLVSHDAALLSETCGRILSIRDAALEDFPGGYDDWLAERDIRQKNLIGEYQQYLRQRRRLIAALRNARSAAGQVKATPVRMGNSEARLHKGRARESSEKLEKKATALASRIERLKAVRRPTPDRELARAFPWPRDGMPRFAAAAADLHLTAGDKLLLDGASFDLPSGSKTCLLGPNGCGKTSLLRMMSGEGAGLLSKNIKCALMRQDLSDLDDGLSALRNVMKTSPRTEPFIRMVLARLRITGDMVFTKVGAMSGGERVKVELARLMMSEVDVLLLDEPTNHMDIESCEALGEVLRAWPGTLLMATHDRALIDTVSDRVIIWDGLGLLTYEGNYTDYLCSIGGDKDINALADGMRRAAEASKSERALIGARTARPGGRP